MEKEEKKAKEKNDFAQKGKDWFNEEFTEETRAITKRKLTIALILAPITFAFDVAISYWAYTSKPVFFIDHEISESFVSWLVTGDFPHALIMSNVFAIFLMLFAYILIKNKKMKYKSSSLPYIIIGLVFNIGHIYGGMSWIPIILS